MVDFAKINAQMAADRARRQAMTPEQLAEEEAQKEQARKESGYMSEDLDMFKGRQLRTISCMLVEGPRYDSRGDLKRISATNDQGRLHVVLKGSRGEFSPEQEFALNRALLGTEKESEEGTASAVPATATGVFKSRSWKDGSGKEHKAWDFVAETMAITYKGETVSFGRPSVLKAEQGPQPPLRKDKDKDEAR